MLNSNSDGLNIIEGCQFIQNEGDGLLQSFESNLKIQNTTFVDNFAEESPSIKLIQSTLAMEDNTFRD